MVLSIRQLAVVIVPLTPTVLQVNLQSDDFDVILIGLLLWVSDLISSQEMRKRSSIVTPIPCPPPHQ